MKNKLVEVQAIRELIRPSPGFAKKLLSDFKLDLLALCGFGCRYCSSNCGNYLRINRKQFLSLTKEQLGQGITPDEDPTLMFVWPNVLEQLRTRLDRHARCWGRGQTLAAR